MASSIIGRHYASFVSTFQLRPPVAVSPVLLCRNYQGSNRQKRKKAKSDKERLGRELQKEYGISKPEFDEKAKLKRDYFSEFLAFQARLNIRFNDHSVLMSAFAHPSFLEDLEYIKRADVPKKETDMLRRFELRDEISDIPYQNLSLLGYETTMLTVKEELYKKYPNILPPICSDVINFLMSRDTISVLAKNLAIEDLLLLSRELDNIKDFSTEYHLQFTKEDLICDTFYSLIGAIEKDLGYAAARSFVKDFLIVLINYEDLNDHVSFQHPQGELNLILKLNGVKGGVIPKTIVESGLNTDFPFFYVGIYCNGCKIGEGSGYSARTARSDGFKNAVYSCLEGEVDFSRLLKAHKQKDGVSTTKVDNIVNNQYLHYQLSEL